MKILSREELRARTESAKILISSYRKSREIGFLKKALSMLLFREYGLENYQPLYISRGAQEILGEECDSLVEHLSCARSRIFPATAGKIRKLGYSYEDFVVEHVVDVSSMVNHLLESDPRDLNDKVMELGRNCPICIVSKEEDLKLKRSDRNNIENPWSEYDKVGIERTKIRDFCGPLGE